ncbi:MAG: phenylalanine--tRNA ligase subunit beta [Clostridia bacterium]|nr:phenylalanine--tRNA ligase subunit beta [Clostridia bacterium]
MILSRNFVKDYIDLDDELSIKQIAEDMTRVGNEYDEARALVNSTNLIIGKVLECEMHPDSDNLHVCKVDVGNEVLQIVCGAPNVAKGEKVIVALPGAVLPGDFKIQKSVKRGVESNGMICALYEIGIDKKFLSEEDKNGIHVLSDDAPVGKDPIEYMKLNDEIIDFDLTANRGDLLSILGMAYELGAIYDKKVKEVDLSHRESGEDLNKSFELKINTPNCSLFLARKVENVEIKESPDFIKNRLIACGVRPINNVVDISNYVMLELGQPLHFYDADRLNGCLEVRQAQSGEKLTTLDEQERILDENDLVISDGNKGIGLAGVMGGLSTEVEETTKNVIIEAAIFDSVMVRKTSKKILRSEASNRFEKGLDPNRTYMAIERACKLLAEYAGGTVVTGMCEYNQADMKDREIEVSYEQINALLGTEIPKEEVLNVYRKLGFTAKDSGTTADVIVPRRRLDISIPEDLIEEVSRIYGVDNIEGKLPVVPMKRGSRNNTLREIRRKMVNLGLNETLTYVLINDKEVHKYTADSFEELRLSDPMTEERSVLRYSLIPSLVKTYEYNKAHYNKDVSIFEIGKGFWKKGEEYGENNKLCALMTGNYLDSLGKDQKVDFYVMKGVAEEILDYLGYGGRYSFVKPKQDICEFHPYQTAEISVNADICGIVGKLHPNETKDDVYVLEINLDKLLEKKTGKMTFKEISKFPSVNKDLAVVVDKFVTSAELQSEIKRAGGKLFLGSKVFDVYQGAPLPPNKKSIAVSLSFGANDRTLTDEEVNTVLNQIIERLEKGVKAELRK